MKIIRTERGWSGHFCAAQSCSFRRNTLLDNGKTRIVISTVGGYRPDYPQSYKVEEIGLDRYYETMVFRAILESNIYWDMDVSSELQFSSPWSINELKESSDMDANDMHERVVEEFTKRMLSGEWK